MRFAKTLLCFAAATFISAGCEHEHHHDRDDAVIGVGPDVAVDDGGGPVVQGSGVGVIDVEPDPAQRVYVYDEGYPPGTYIYQNYYYYGGYRYPRDVFINQYVHENITRHRYVNTDDNRRQGQPIEQRQRTEFTQTRGVRQGHQPAQQMPDRNQAGPERHDVAPPANIERHDEDQRAPRPIEQNRQRVEPAPGNLQDHNRVDRPENGQPPRVENGPRQEHPAEQARPENEEHRQDGDGPKHEENK